LREDESGDWEDGELPCVIGESDEAREVHWRVRSIEKVQRSEKSD